MFLSRNPNTEVKKQRRELALLTLQSSDPEFQSGDLQKNELLCCSDFKIMFDKLMSMNYYLYIVTNDIPYSHLKYANIKSITIL